MKTLLQRYTMVFTFLIAFIAGCSKSGSETNKMESILPGKAVGILPVNGETCTDFEEVSGEANMATITISWSAAENASSYLVQVFESDVEIGDATATTNQSKFTLEKGKSYSWMVTAKNNNGETQSDTFSFITPGEAIGNYVPFAAEITMLYNTNNGELAISWIGNDGDGDLLTYDVVVMENDAIIEEQEDLTTVELDPINALAGATYNVQVKSKDSFGNFSISIHTITIAD
ncbi:MAG: hypothetical protein RIB64_06050 [Arenibacter algicola]|tara:strand:+ start:743 stop:1438 length:696 start_codon:yes stop_codon:yes gene_type:complete